MTNKLMDILLGISSTIVVIGAIFKIQHYPYGDSILTLGLLASILISGIEIRRLRQIIKDKEYR